MFARYPDAAAYAAADRAELEEMIKPTGFFRAKTDSLIKLGAALVERFDGEVPATLDELVTLPGVGRKTANVVLGNAFGVPGHHRGHPLRPAGPPLRLDRRETDPDKVEAAVGALFPPRDWTQLCHNVDLARPPPLPCRATPPAAPARSPAGARRTARGRPTRSRRPSWSASRADENVG